MKVFVVLFGLAFVGEFFFNLAHCGWFIGYFGGF
jgi:hypothetical protein